MKKLKYKLKAIWQIITRSSGFVITIESKELGHLIQDKDFHINGAYFGLSNYPFYKIIKAISANQDDIDMTLEKAKFEAELEEEIQKIK